MSNPVMKAVSEVGNATRSGDQDRIARAQQQLAIARIEREIGKACNGAYPITDEQRQRLAATLTGGA